jgi:hypothetical protein
MNSPVKSWLLIHFRDIPNHNDLTLFNDCCQYLNGRLSIKTQIIDLSPRNPTRFLGDQGLCGSQGSTGPIGWIQPPTPEQLEQRRKEEEERCEQERKRVEEQLRKEEARKAATWRDLLNEVHKGQGYNSFLFRYARYHLSGTSCFILVNAESLAEEITQASFFFPCYIEQSYTNRQAVQRALRLEKRFNQEQVYLGGNELRSIIEWINLVIGEKIELPPLRCQVLDFETEDDYQADQQREIQRQQQERAEWDQKYRVSPVLAIAPNTCEITGEENVTCVIIGEFDNETEIISLDYLMREAAKRGLPFGNQRLG